MDAESTLISELLTPPATPIGLKRPWESIEQELGIVLPTDYKWFIDRYGSGLISNEIVVWNFRDPDYFQSKEPLPEVLSGEGGPIAIYEKISSEEDCDWQYPMYPNPGGLLPFAMVIDVDHLNWLTIGPSDEWDIVYWCSDYHELIHLQGDTFTRFLLKLMRHEYDSNSIPEFEPPYEFTVLSR